MNIYTVSTIIRDVVINKRVIIKYFGLVLLGPGSLWFDMEMINSGKMRTCSVLF